MNFQKIASLTQNKISISGLCAIIRNSWPPNFLPAKCNIFVRLPINGSALKTTTIILVRVSQISKFCSGFYKKNCKIQTEKLEKLVEIFFFFQFFLQKFFLWDFCGHEGAKKLQNYYFWSKTKFSASYLCSTSLVFTSCFRTISLLARLVRSDIEQKNKNCIQTFSLQNGYLQK